MGFIKKCGILFFLFISMPYISNAGVTDDLTPCVLFLIQDVKPGQNANIGSGILVSKNNFPYIVTAEHVALNVGSNCTILLPNRNGDPDTLKATEINWKRSTNADVAIYKVDINDQRIRTRLLKRSVPFSLLSGRPLPPSRDIPLTVMGYPLGLGSTGHASPLSLETKAASGFITLSRFDNSKPATFILLQDESIGGLSGGPVFDTGRTYFSGARSLTARGGGVSIVGIIHGVIGDETGGKFAAVVPSTEIVKLFESE